MDLKIISKLYPKNDKRNTNKVYFKLDGKDMVVNIIYISSLKRNAFLTDGYLKELEEFVKQHYNCSFNDFGNYFLHKLYLYSRGIGLNPVGYKDLSNVEYK